MYLKEKWSDLVIQQVWAKGKIDANNDPAVFRKDACNAWIRFLEHGNRNSQYGWEIDHIRPVSQGGGDQLTNLQPLNWQNNAAKGDSSILQCAVRS